MWRKMTQECVVLLGLLICASPLEAQPVQQSGSVTPGHAAQWVTTGVIKDAGSAAAGNLTSIGVTASGPAVCQRSAATGAYNLICLNATSTSGGISLTNVGGATGGFTFTLNGVTQGLATVTLPVTTNDAACFANSTGTLMDCGVAPTAPGIVTMYPGSVGQTSGAWTVVTAYGLPISTSGTTSQGLQQAINASFQGLGTASSDLNILGGDNTTGGALVLNSSATITWPVSQGKTVRASSVTYNFGSGLGTSAAFQFDSQMMLNFTSEGAQIVNAGTGYSILFKPTNGVPLDLLKNVTSSKFYFKAVNGPVGFDLSTSGSGATNSTYEFGEILWQNAPTTNTLFYVPTPPVSGNFTGNIISIAQAHGVPSGATAMKLGSGAPSGGAIMGRNFYTSLNIAGSSGYNGIDTYEAGSYFLAIFEGSGAGVPIRTRSGANNNVFIVPYNFAPTQNVEGATGNILIGGGVLSVGTVAPVSGAVFQARLAADHNLTITTSNSLADGVTLNSVNDANSLNKGIELRGSAIALNQGPVTSNSSISASLGLSSGAAAGVSGSVTLVGLTSGSAIITVPSVAGTPTLTLGSSSGTPAVTATSPLVITASTGNISCPTCSTGTTLVVGTTTITSGSTTRVLYDNAGVLGEYTITGTGTVVAMQTAPTFVTSITAPLVIGGTAAGSTLILESTSGTGTSDFISFKTASQSERVRIDTNGLTTFSVNATAIGSLAAAQTGAIIRGVGVSGASTRLQLDAYGAQAFFTTLCAGGTPASPTTITSGTQCGGYNMFAYDGTAFAGPAATFRTFANQNWAVGAHGAYAEVAVTASGTTTLTTAIRFEADGGITVPPTVTGGDKGVGTINMAGCYVSNVACLTTGSTIPLTVGTTTIASGTTTRILYDNAGVLGEYTLTGTGTVVAMQTAPTFVTSITSPIVIGSTAVGGSLSLQSTSGVGTTDFVRILTGNNGATEVARFLHGGSVGFGTTTPNFFFQINSPSGTHALMQFTNATTGSTNADGAYFGILDGALLFRIYNIENAGILFATNNTAAMYVSPTSTVGIGSTFTGAIEPANTLSFSGQVAQTIGVERISTANTAGVAMTHSAGGAASGATNKAGGTLNLLPGVSTGSGTSSVVIQAYQTSAGAAVDNTTNTIATFSDTGVVVNRGTLTVASVNLSATSNQIVFQSAGVTGTLSWAPASTNKTITLPNGTTDFTATGGTSQVVKQVSAGAAFTVGQLAASDLSNGVTGSGAVVLASAPSIASLTVTTAFTATGLVANASLVNASTTVNGQTCTLGSTCTISASAGSMTVGTTTVLSGTTTRILYNNAGVLGEYTLTGTGTVVAMQTSPALITPALGVATATSVAIGGCTIGADTFCVTGTTTHNGTFTVSGASLILSGNISAAAWTTSGIRYKSVAATLTDTSSSGTVATAYTNVYGGNTIAASSSTTYTNYFTTYLIAPTVGTNVTFTNSWALGADSAKIGTSNQLTITAAGAPTILAQSIFNIATTIASATAAVLDDVKVSAATTTITGNTGSPITLLAKVGLYRPTLTDSSAVTVSDAATLYIDNSPLAAGSVTITRPWSLLVAAGNVKISTSTTTSSTTTGALVVTGGIASGGAIAALSTSGYLLDNTKILFSDATYTYIADPSGVNKFFFGNASDKTSYFRQDTFQFQPIDGSVNWFTVTAAGVSMNAGMYFFTGGSFYGGATNTSSLTFYSTNQTGTTDYVAFRTGAGEAARIVHSGGFSVGTTTDAGIGAILANTSIKATTTLTVVGMGSAATTSAVCYNTGTGLTTYNATVGTCTVSLLSAKNLVAPLSSKDSLRMVLNMQTWRYTMKKDTPTYLPGEQIGFVADYAEKVDKRLVAYNHDGSLAGFRYEQYGAVLTGAVKELYGEFKEAVTKLKADNDNLRKRIDTLEKRRATR